MKIIWIILFAFFLVSGSLQAQSADSWTYLFNGKNLEGWSIHSGQATYRVENEEVIGTTVPKSPNTFLCTDGTYGDFILEFEVFLTDPELNSGVQFRSHIAPEPMTFWFRDREGIPKPKTIPADRVYGYQVEIATETGGASGGVYDEARRAFMIYRPQPGSAASRAFRNGQWNQYRVECKGSSIKTFINGIPCADFNDHLTSEGVICLQVHGVGDDPTPYQVKWRNIRIKSLP